jgi:FkbM family methyltransferase
MTLRNFAEKALRRGQRATIRGWDAVRPTFSVRVGGRLVKIPAVPATGWILRWRPDWKTQLIGRFLQQRAGLFLDVGANIGQTLLDYAACENRAGYIGFDPAPQCVQLLTEIVRMNGLADCRIVPVALADSVGILEFYTRGPVDPAASLLSEIEPLRANYVTHAPGYTLDAIAPSLVRE